MESYCSRHSRTGIISNCLYGHEIPNGSTHGNGLPKNSKDLCELEFKIVILVAPGYFFFFIFAELN